MTNKYVIFGNAGKDLKKNVIRHNFCLDIICEERQNILIYRYYGKKNKIAILDKPNKLIRGSYRIFFVYNDKIIIAGKKLIVLQGAYLITFYNNNCIKCSDGAIYNLDLMLVGLINEAFTIYKKKPNVMCYNKYLDIDYYFKNKIYTLTDFVIGNKYKTVFWLFDDTNIKLTIKDKYEKETFYEFNTKYE